MSTRSIRRCRTPGAAVASRRPGRGGSRSPLPLLLVLAALALANPATAAEEFRLVAHPGVPKDFLTRKDASDLFLKKESQWIAGLSVKPVTPGVPELEEAFAAEVHGRKLDAIKKFWQRQIFSGQATPPPQMKSEAELLEYVRTTPGAIGFVAARTPVGSGVKVLELR